MEEATITLNEVNKSATNTKLMYDAIDSAAISYMLHSGDQYWHLDEKSMKKFLMDNFPVRSCLQACSNDTKLTAVAEHNDVFDEKTSILDLIDIISMQHECFYNSNLLYPQLDEAFSSLSKQQIEIPREVLQENFPLLHLPCFVKESSMSKYTLYNFVSRPEGILKKERISHKQRTIATRRLEGRRAKPKPMMAKPIRDKIEEAKSEVEMVDPNHRMKTGDIIVMPGGLVHKGRSDPGKSKIYYTFRPRGLEEYNEYQHEEQIDGLEVWVILCSQIWKQLCIEARRLIFRHIITAYVVALTSQFRFYTRYDQHGLLYHYFRLLDDCFWKHYGKSRRQKKQSWTLGLVYEGNRLPKDPRDLFEKLPKDSSGFDKYKFSDLAQEVWNKLYQVADSHKMWEVDNLFSDSTTAIKIQKFLNIDTKKRLAMGSECYVLDDAGAMWFQVPEKGKKLSEEVVNFIKGISLGSHVFQLDQPKYNKFFVYCEIFETSDQSPIEQSAGATEVEFDNDDDLTVTSARVQFHAASQDTSIPEGAIPFEDGQTVAGLVEKICDKYQSERSPPKQRKRKS
jgi:hypothetical protein